MLRTFWRNIVELPFAANASFLVTIVSPAFTPSNKNGSSRTPAKTRRPSVCPPRSVHRQERRKTRRAANVPVLKGFRGRRSTAKSSHLYLPRRAIAFNYLAVAGRSPLRPCPQIVRGTRSMPVPAPSVWDSRGGPTLAASSRAPDGAQQDVRLAPVASASPGPRRTPPAPPAAGGIWPRGQVLVVLAGARDRSESLGIAATKLEKLAVSALHPFHEAMKRAGQFRRRRHPISRSLCETDDLTN